MHLNFSVVKPYKREELVTFFQQALELARHPDIQNIEIAILGGGPDRLSAVVMHKTEII